jgi:hypothetical protein
LRKRQAHKRHETERRWSEERRLKELELFLPLIIIKYGPASESRRNRALMPRRFTEVSDRRSLLFDIANEAIQPGKAVKLF